MIRIDELIEECCPDGVQVVTLGDVGTIFGGLTGKSKKDFSNGNARFISYVNVFNNIAVDTSANDFVMVAAGERQHGLRKGDVLFTGSSETAGEVAMSAVVTVDVTEPLYLNSFSIGYRFNEPDVLDPEFAKHLFRSVSLRRQLVKTASGVTRFNVSKARLAAVKIPVPPLAIQHEIASVLDKMNELEAELEAELEYRSRQYSYYRNSLLHFDQPGCRQVALGEIAEFKYGYTASAKAEGDYRFIRITDINASGKLSPGGAKFVDAGGGADDYLVCPGDLLMARTGATYGKTMLVEDGDWAVYASFLIRIRLDPTKMLPTYYWHFAQSSFYWEQANAMVSTGGQPQFNANVLRLVNVPLPSLAEQARAVSILDKFDALVNDLSSGLPAEIGARRRQYEYYRDRLLTFKELVA